MESEHRGFRMHSHDAWWYSLLFLGDTLSFSCTFCRSYQALAMPMVGRGRFSGGDANMWSLSGGIGSLRTTCVSASPSVVVVRSLTVSNVISRSVWICARGSTPCHPSIWFQLCLDPSPATLPVCAPRQGLRSEVMRLCWVIFNNSVISQ